MMHVLQCFTINLHFTDCVGQASRPIASPDSEKPAQATAAAAQERARDLGGAQHSSYCASMPPSKQSSSALGP